MANIPPIEYLSLIISLIAMAVSLAVWFDRQVTVNRVIKIALAALEEAEEAVEIVRGYNKEEN